MKTDKELIEKKPIQTDCVSKQEYNALNDKYLRSVADYQNLKRRTEEKNTQVLLEMKKDLINQFLPIVDDLQLVANELKEESLFMIFRKTILMFAENQIYQYAEEGEEFDDNLHNAIMVENNPEKENNTILKVYKHGYKLGDNIIRYADVIVNKIE